MTEAEERHLRLEQAADDLNEAWRVAYAIREAGEHSLVGPAFKYLLVAYARPFKYSRGSDGQRRGPESELVPTEHEALHASLISARDKVIAHSDLTVREPQLHVAESSARQFAIVVQNVVHGTEELGRLDEIVALIEAVLRRLYERIGKSESSLPVTTRR